MQPLALGAIRVSAIPIPTEVADFAGHKRPQQRLRRDEPNRRWNLSKQIGAVCPFSRLDRNPKPDVRIAVSPIGRKPRGDQPRTLCEDLVGRLRGFTDDLPGVLAPLVGLRVKPVGPGTGEDEVASVVSDCGLALGGPFATLNWSEESWVSGPDDHARVFPIAGLVPEHVAVVAALRDFVAA